MLNHADDSVEGKTAVVSGSGNVATYAIEKLNHFGAKVVTASDSGGFIHDPDGIDAEKLEWLKDLKEVRRGRISEYAEHFGCEFHEGERPWNVPCELALPCATQNEVSLEDAQTLVDNGVRAVSEGANMPTELDGVRAFKQAGVLFGPAKAANAGGVAVSGLEQSQNALRISSVARRGRQPPQDDHARDPRHVCRVRRRLRRGRRRRLRGRSEHRWLRQGRRRDARVRRRVSPQVRADTNLMTVRTSAGGVR